MFNIKMLALATAASTLVTSAALAQEMRCGNHLVAGDQIHPMVKEQVLEKCGEPTTKDWDRWFYKKQGKVLVFNGNGELDHIEDVQDSQ